MIINWQYIKRTLNIKKRDAETAARLGVAKCCLDRWCSKGFTKNHNNFLDKCRELGIDFNKLFKD
jgi:hypothetical protein